MSRFDVDTAKQQTPLEEAARRCGVELDVHGSGSNVRIDCPFGCHGDHAGKREISVSREGDKLFRCHAYGCGFRGNLLKLMHGWLTGSMPRMGNLKGDDFKRVRDVLVGGDEAHGRIEKSARRDDEPEAPAPQEPVMKRNTPLCASENEKARELVGLETLLITDPAEMNPSASRYFRERRRYLTSELCAEWGVGVRPTRNAGDKRGWSLRGQVCYRFLSEDNKVLCYVGRDPDFEDKVRTFESLSDEQRAAQKLKPPIKHKFPAGFHRGLELFGQQRSRLDRRPEYREFIAEHGVIVVEGFNDVLALDHLGVPAVAICSNRITEQQVAKAIRWANHLGGKRVSLMFDCEAAGDEGAKDALWLFAQAAPDVHVRLVWSQAMHGGRFRGREPESLHGDELRDFLLSALKG